MKAEKINELANELAYEFLSDAVTPVETSRGYNWQRFTAISDEEKAKLLEFVDVEFTAFSNCLQIEITIDGMAENLCEQYKDLLNKLKARNLCLLADKVALAKKEKEAEQRELLEEAASLMGVSVEELKKGEGEK